MPFQALGVASGVHSIEERVDGILHHIPSSEAHHLARPLHNQTFKSSREPRHRLVGANALAQVHLLHACQRDDQGQVFKPLETVSLKTIAASLNSRSGGTLLIASRSRNCSPRSGAEPWAGGTAYLSVETKDPAYPLSTDLDGAPFGRTVTCVAFHP